MRVDLFDFDLPDDRIALRPAEPRDSARMLVVRPGEGLADKIVRDLPDLLRPGDVIVLNDTKVIPSRLHGVRTREAAGGGEGGELLRDGDALPADRQALGLLGRQDEALRGRHRGCRGCRLGRRSRLRVRVGLSVRGVLACTHRKSLSV